MEKRHVTQRLQANAELCYCVSSFAGFIQKLSIYSQLAWDFLVVTKNKKPTVIYFQISWCPQIKVRTWMQSKRKKTFGQVFPCGPKPADNPVIWPRSLTGEPQHLSGDCFSSTAFNYPASTSQKIIILPQKTKDKKPNKYLLDINNEYSNWIWQVATHTHTHNLWEIKIASLGV